MNKEYIERAEVISLINRLKINFTHEAQEILDAVCDCINIYVDSVEVEPIRFGKWVNINSSKWKCSECGYEVEQYNNTFYCPKCGAKMY